ncbi:hypothetical protein J4233_03460 [Candidatus Pacearchaeota archaeon]|nr:hypothetical protein [Candidatus Pacearchaeota archaeon]
MTIEVRLKKWGNSIGIVIPNETIERLSLKPEEQIVIEISKKENVLKEMFGKARFKKSARKVIDDFRKDSESKWLK